MPRDVLSAGLAYGYCGSDVWEETGSGELPGLAAEPVLSLDGLRFALACLPEKRNNVRAKLRSGEPLLFGTSYPATLRRVMGDVALSPFLRAGAIEGLPARFPEIDGIFEIVKSGDSLIANGLVVAVDNLEVIKLMEVTRNGEGL